MKTKRKHAVIIGGGLGGLGLALRLARRNMDVTICEKNSSVGGKMNIHVSDGFRFDTGPSLITLLDVFRETFQDAGELMENFITPVRIKPLAHYVFPDGTSFDYTSSIPEWNETIKRIGSHKHDHFYNFMQLGARIYMLSKNTFFSQSPYQFPPSLNLKALRYFPLKNAWGKYSKTVSLYFQSQYLQQMFNRYPTYVGSSPFHTPATLIIIPYIEYAYGGWFIKGGLYQIIENLKTLCEKNGVQIKCNTNVREILHKNLSVSGIRTENGSEISADIVIMNGDASMTPILLGDSSKRNIPPNRRSLSGIVFLIGVSKTLPDLPHHSIYFSASYEKEFSDLFTERKFPEDPTVYVNAASRTDRSLVQGEGETLFIMANAPANDNDSWDKEMIESVWNSVYNRLLNGGFPDIRKDIKHISVWTPKNFAERYCMPGGAIYGQYSHGWRATFLRPPNKDRKYKHLYYVGGSTHPGGGTPMVLLSAKITADLIKKYEI